MEATLTPEEQADLMLKAAIHGSRAVQAERRRHVALATSRGTTVAVLAFVVLLVATENFWCAAALAQPVGYVGYLSAMPNQWR